MLNPGLASDALLTEETYEWACALKHELQKKFPLSLRVSISHGIHEKPDQPEIASFTNRLPTDLYITLHLCKNAQAMLHVYTRADHPVTDYWHTKPNSLVLLPTVKAHTLHAKLSRSLSEQLVTLLKKQAAFTPRVTQAYGLPFMPLQGIQAPAFALELSVSKAKEWRLSLSPLVEALSEVLASLTARSK